MPTRQPAETLDRRVRRTRTSIISAFNHLVLEQGYAPLTPGAVAAAANVGRSTFYEHFRGIDDLLSTTLATVLAPMAAGCFQAELSVTALRAVEHFWDQRRLASLLLKGEAQGIVLQSFARQFELALQSHLGENCPGPMLRLELIAVLLAGGQLALLTAWISGRFGHSAQEITAALHASGRASLLALAASPGLTIPFAQPSMTGCQAQTPSHAWCQQPDIGS